MASIESTQYIAGTVSLSPRMVAYARATGPYANSARDAWQLLIAWLEERGLKDRIRHGWGWLRDDPLAVSPFLLRYDACVSLTPGIGSDLRSGIGRQLLPGGTFVPRDRDRHLATTGEWIEACSAAAMGRQYLSYDRSGAMLEEVQLTPDGVGHSASRLLVPVITVAGRGLPDRQVVA